jgi:Ring finger domain
LDLESATHFFNLACEQDSRNNMTFSDQQPTDMWSQWLPGTALSTFRVARGAAGSSVRHHRLPSQDDDDDDDEALATSCGELELPAPPSAEAEPQQAELVSLPQAVEGEATAPHSPSTIPSTSNTPIDMAVLSRLNKERDLLRQCSGVFIFFALSFLVNTWLVAIVMCNFLLLAVASSGTALFLRFMQYYQSRDDDLSQQISEMEQSVVTNTVGVSEAAQQQWKRLSYQANPDEDADDPKKLSSDLNCSICLADYERDEILVQLPCSHGFHQECIMLWASHHTNCPLCNFDLEMQVV